MGEGLLAGDFLQEEDFNNKRTPRRLFTASPVRCLQARDVSIYLHHVKSCTIARGWRMASRSLISFFVTMGRYGQLVMGPAGAGKSTYCSVIQRHCENTRRSVHVRSCLALALGLFQRFLIIPLTYHAVLSFHYTHLWRL